MPSAPRPRRLGRLDRIARGIAARRRRRKGARAGSGRNRGCAACRSSRRGPSSPGRSRRRLRPGVIASASARIRGRAAGSGSSTANSRATTRSTLAVDHHRPPAEGDRGDRGGGIGADAGQLAQRRLVRPGSGRHARRPPSGRRRAGCGRGHNSRAPPRRPSPPRPAAAASASTVGQRRVKASK